MNNNGQQNTATDNQQQQQPLLTAEECRAIGRVLANHLDPVKMLVQAHRDVTGEGKKVNTPVGNCLLCASIVKQAMWATLEAVNDLDTVKDLDHLEKAGVEVYPIMCD